MILVFGGTTEGRKAVEVLEEGGSPYFYSTKTGEQDITLHHGQRIDGALDESPFFWFQKSHGAIELSEDAASVDVSRQKHRGIYHAGKAHVHDVFLL